MNDKIFFFFYGLAHQSAFLDHMIVFFADIFPYLIIIAVGIFLLFHHDMFGAQNPIVVIKQKYREILPVFLSGVVAWILAHTFKILLSMPRPAGTLEGVMPLFHEMGNGFPSGHSAFFMALAFSIFFIHKKAGYVFIAFAVLIGVARIAAGVHFPLDILGGFVLGYLIAYFLKNV